MHSNRFKYLSIGLKNRIWVKKNPKMSGGTIWYGGKNLKMRGAIALVVLSLIGILLVQS